MGVSWLSGHRPASALFRVGGLFRDAAYRVVEVAGDVAGDLEYFGRRPYGFPVGLEEAGNQGLECLTYCRVAGEYVGDPARRGPPATSRRIRFTVLRIAFSSAAMPDVGSCPGR